MNAHPALIELFKVSYEWRTFFRSCCETSTLRLRSQAWQFREELKDRGHKLQAEEVEDALLRLARDLLPDTPAAQWDVEWAHELCKDALACLAKAYARLSAEEKGAVDLSVQEEWDERMHVAGLTHDPVTFRAALQSWERAGMDAIWSAQVRGGAA